LCLSRHSFLIHNCVVQYIRYYFEPEKEKTNTETEGRAEIKNEHRENGLSGAELKKIMSIREESGEELCVGIHKHCTVAEILVFGRETGFPIQTLQRCYLYKSHQEMETNLKMFY
jgi:hypothetical protein